MLADTPVSVCVLTEKMWRKSVQFCVKRINSTTQSRWLHQIKPPGTLYNPGSEALTIATFGDVLSATAQSYPGRVAVNSIHEGICITYEELLTQADALGCAFRDQGLVKGDRVGLWSHNMAGWIVALIAASRAGLISVLINPVYEIEELTFCIKKTGMKSLFFGEQLPSRNYYHVLKQLIPELDGATPGKLKSKAFPELTSLINGGKEKLNGTFGFYSLINEYRNRNEISKYGKEVKPEDGGLIHFTSGTTGEPKAALDSHIGIVNNTYFIGLRNTFHEGHHNICVQVPLFHALGSIVTVLAGLRHGCSLVLAAPTYNVASNIDAMLSHKCTVITGTPTMYVDMLRQLHSKGHIPSQLKVALAAGAPCSPQVIRDIDRTMKAKVKALYGLTETTACVFQSIDGDTVDRVAETVGYIQDHVEVKVVDDKGVSMPFGTAGELMVRGYNNMICYWDEPEKTRKAFDKDGWLYTGDKFEINEDGYGRVVGRLKDIIVRGGENIAPKEIEDLLNTHPDILESQVVGVSDERLGEELCVVLRLQDGAKVTMDDVTKHLTGRVARFKIPRMLKLMDEFPKTASGKIQKFRIRELIETGKL